MGESDFVEQEKLFRQAQSLKFDFHQLQERGINPGSAKAIDRAHKQLLHLLSQPAADNALKKEGSDEQISVAILAGYPDRVAKRQESDNALGLDFHSASKMTLKFSNGTVAQLAPESAVRSSAYLVAVEATEKQANRSVTSIIRTAVAIQPDWLLDLFPDEIHEHNQVIWNANQERVEVVSQLLYDQLVLDESKVDFKNLSSELEGEIANTLFDAAKKQGWQHFVNSVDMARLQARVDFMQRTFPEIVWPSLGDEEILAVLKSCCNGKRSFRDLHERINLASFSQALFSNEQRSLLNRMAPETIHFAGRKNLRVNYEFGQSPWIASRLQDFFGLLTGPKIADGRTALVLHLLAPNQRPVQITQDLAGFWQRNYPQVRRELSRRYPKHAWPEDPIYPQKKL